MVSATALDMVSFPAAGLRQALIVDDVPTAHTIPTIVSRRLGLTSLHASDGLRAINILRRRPIDLILTDIEMPRCTGLTLLDWVRRNAPNRLRTIPVVVISSLDDRELLRSIRQQRDTYFVPKPVEVERLEVTLKLIATARWLTSRSSGRQRTNL